MKALQAVRTGPVAKSLLRKERGLTQEGFAESVGLTVSAVSKIEIGDRVPSIDTFVLLSGFFGVSLDYIVLGKEH